MQDIDPRLVPIVGPDRSINMIRLGHIEHKHRTRPQTMNKVQLDVRAAILEDPLAARILTNAARIYEEHLKAQVREHGGTIVTDRSRIDADGRRTTTQTVKRYPPSRATRPTRVRSRTREHRPGATRRTSSSSTSASADPPADDSDEPEPVATGRLCHCCEPPRQVRYCVCGCEREITHRRADAKTFGASCRQKLSRAAARERFEPAAARSCQCERVLLPRR